MARMTTISQASVPTKWAGQGRRLAFTISHRSLAATLWAAESTLIVALGEFGRTAKINALGGRDHWPAAQSVFLAGAGVPPGTVIGSTDAEGAYPSSRPVRLNDFFVTFFRILGFNANVDDRLRAFIPSGELVDEIVSTA